MKKITEVEEQYNLFIENGFDNSSIIDKCDAEMYLLSKPQNVDTQYGIYARKRKVLLRKVKAYAKKI